MDLMHLCQCCLRCPPDQYLTTPYIHLGKTEIYSDMLKECFDLQILTTLEIDGHYGICKECVSHLRDASNFKLQVQRSQAKLLALHVKEEPVLKSEPSEMDIEETDETIVKSEMDIQEEILPILSPASTPEGLGQAIQTYTKIDSTQTHKLKNNDTSSDINEDNNMGMLTPTEIQQTALVKNMLPLKSRMKYKKAYEHFISWKNDKKATSISESVLLEYFKELSKTFKPSTLWSIYSMLKATIHVEHNINMKLYSKLTNLLKKLSSGFNSKKSNFLTAENVETFLREAPDEIYLATKVALILGVNGACTAAELVDLKTSDIEEHNNMIQIKLSNTKTRTNRSFTIRDQYLNIVKKYQSLRPMTEHDRFFLHYRNGICNIQPMGRHKLADTPEKIAKYLKLPDAECYSGHSFRRTSAILLAESADLNTLMRRGGWASTKIAEGYEESVKNKVKRNGEMNKDINLSSASNTSTSNICDEYIPLSPHPPAAEIVQNINVPAKNVLISVKNCPNSSINFNFK